MQLPGCDFEWMKKAINYIIESPIEYKNVNEIITKYNFQIKEIIEKKYEDKNYNIDYYSIYFNLIKNNKIFFLWEIKYRSLHENKLDDLNVIYNVNFLKRWLIKWLWEYMLEKFFKEYSVYKRVKISDILSESEWFYKIVLERLKEKWIIKNYKMYKKRKFFNIFEENERYIFVLKNI